MLTAPLSYTSVPTVNIFHVTLNCINLPYLVVSFGMTHTHVSDAEIFFKDIIPWPWPLQDLEILECHQYL